MTIYIIIDGEAQLTKATLDTATAEIFERGVTICILVFIIVAPVGVSYLMAHHFTGKLFLRFYDHFGALSLDRDSLFVQKDFNNESVKVHAMDAFAQEL